eukprot:CAMPEP_0119383684 /NCGR_PEP_ID=MMETSP1334-20130426/81189_1 /TAXON_ID=127549 /ORGANISM="Calcidiscus leptoporus, Strain RCC1130" /LENGTH=92 /DNA_ID=CAMNT_0007404557 /DNA_START=339 /DNA_END=614 /DNA_ORIENTATION=+
MESAGERRGGCKSRPEGMAHHNDEVLVLRMAPTRGGSVSRKCGGSASERKCPGSVRGPSRGTCAPACASLMFFVAQPAWDDAVRAAPLLNAF